MLIADKFISREEVSRIPTPEATVSWKPVPHIEVIDAVIGGIRTIGWNIIEEQYGLGSEGQKFFGVIRLSQTNSPDWSRCIGIRNSHDKSISVGLTAGINVLVCSNLAFGGSMVLKRRHTSRIELDGMVMEAIKGLELEFKTLETVADDLKTRYLNDTNARSFIVRAAENQAIPSCDVLNVWERFKKPDYEAFKAPTAWGLLNAFTEVAKKYSPARADLCHRNLTRLFGLDGRESMLFKRD